MKKFLPRALVAVAIGTPIVAAAAPALAVATPLGCTSAFYQVLSGQLAQFDPASGEYLDIGVDQPSYNAMGYRIADGYLYAIRSSTLLQIDANGSVTELGSVAIVPGSYTGDFGDDGLLHVSRGGADWYSIDVDTLAATPVAGLSQGKSVADIANISGVFYGVSSQGRLWKFDPADESVTDGGAVTGLPSSSNAYGAAWATAGGNLYVGRNSGEIYQITGYSTGSPQATQIATSTSTSSNDGASCATAPPPPGIPDIDGPEPEVAPSTPETQAAAASYAASYEAPQYSIPDAGLGTGATCEATVDEDRVARVGFDALTVASPTVLYDNDFLSDSVGFSVASGSWLVENGSFVQLNSCGFDYTAMLQSYRVESFDLEVVFHSVDGANQGGVVVNQSSTDTRSGAILVDLADDGATLRWGTYDSAGYYQNLGWDLIPAPLPGEPVLLRLEVRGDDVTIFHNGNQVVTVQTANPGGMIGLVTSQAHVAFDRVTLTAMPTS